VTKRTVLLRFALLAAGLLAAAAVVGIGLSALVGGWAGAAAIAVAFTVLLLAGWGIFAHNSSLFGHVIDGPLVHDRVLALTFDDGPSRDTTPRVLDALRAAGVQATFFVLGRHTEQHPDLVAQMRAEGHEVASHGYDHRLLPFASRDEVRTQLALTEDAILIATGTPPERLFRAPHGFRGPAVGRVTLEQGYRVVGWTKGVWDTARPGAEVIAERAERGFRPGAILLLHDADGSGQGGDRSQTAEALPRILSAADAAGYRFLTISEMAGHARPRRLTAWRVALVAALCAVLLEFTLRRVDTSALQAVDIGWWWVGASLAANLLSIVTKATVWKCCLDAVPDHRSVRYAQVVPALFVGFLLNTLLVARLGDLARIGVLARRLKIEGQPMRATTIAGTVVTEQVVIGVALAATLAAMAAALPVPKWARDLVLVFVMVVVVLGLALFGLELLARARRARTGGRVPARDSAAAWWRNAMRALEAFLNGLVSGQQLYRRPRLAGLAIVAGLVSWAAQIAGIFWALEAFGIDAGIGAAALVFLTTTLVQLFPILPGNVGVFQVAVNLTLVQAYGVSAATALAFGIGLQVIEVTLGAGLGFVFLSREGLSFAEARGLRASD
jgi:peptidoglycan-N-acetylglucosamine deacetylase